MDGATSDEELPPVQLYRISEDPFSFKFRETEYREPFVERYSGESSYVIDNGTWQTRAGYSSDKSPRILFPPLISRYRDRKIGRGYTLVGNDVYADQNAKALSRTPFDSNIVSNIDVMETILDYIFIKLGARGDGGLDRGVIMTEPVCNPSQVRKGMSELLFEGYLAPSVTYGIDSLFSFNYNKGSSGLVISASATSTHLIPVFSGAGLVSQSTRLNWGGMQSSEYLLKLLQLKYPSFPTKMSSAQAENLMIDHCFVSSAFLEDTNTILRDKGVLEREDRVIQFPFTEVVVVEKTEEELARIAERRKESGRRLQEQAQKMRLEKLMKKEQELEFYKDLLAKAQTETKKEFKRLLEANDFRDEMALQKAVRELDKTIRRSRKQDIGDDEDEDAKQSFALLEVPDEELDEDALKQKKHQRLMKSNWDARQRAKAEKEAERARLQEEERRDQEAREKDLDGWVKERRGQREAMVAKIRERQRLKLELNDRKSLASQIRMKSIANLASDMPNSKKRRRGGGEGGDDNFGANDDDWAVYRNIGTGNQSENEEEEELNTALKAVEEQLIKFDPGFDASHTQEALADWSNSLLHAFLRGTRPFNPDSQTELNQIHVNIERFRVPEVIFQPSMGGVDQAGLIEIASQILLNRLPAQHPPDTLLKDVFLTGGYALFTGFEERVRNELRAVLPAGAPLMVRTAKDPILDAWKGAASWSLTDEWKQARITREDYLEKGAEYLKDHRLGNPIL